MQTYSKIGRRLTLRFVLPLVLVLLTGCQVFEPVGTFTKQLVDLSTGNTPRKAAVQMEDSKSADNRREGINNLVDRRFGQGEPYTARYMQIAEFDADPLVRASAVRALNRARWKDATPLFIKALSDDSDLVQLEAAKALANVPDPAALPALLRTVNDAAENKDVRISAADALRNHAQLEVARTLVAQLGNRDFGIAWQSRHSLQLLTHKDLRYDQSAWLQFLTGPDKPFG